MKYSFKLLVLALLPCATFLSQAQENKNVLGVYPTPHEVKIQKAEQIKATALKVRALSNDKDTMAALSENFKTGADGFPLIIGLADNPQLKALAGGIHDKRGAYKLIIDASKIVLIGHDDAGMFYAVQTLAQLAKKSPSGEFTLPVVTINDWPDIEQRGVVEGYYGPPWSFDAKMRMIKFYGQFKLNTYIYGPKDDPFHGFSNRWREPYPEEQAKQLAQLVKIAHQNKVDFIWTVHPGRSITWGKADQEAAVKKFEMMYNIGFRAFGVFFDDIGGTAGEPEGQADFLNYINREFIHKKKDVRPLFMCPTEYSGRGGQYHDTLVKTLDKDISIMWTGRGIVSDIRKDDLASVNGHTKRKAYIWWNYPVIDYVRHYLMMGRVYGIDKGTADMMSGFTANPMDKAEASKIALFGVADLTWNMEDFDSVKSWKDSIKILFPQCADAMQTFANHNSDPGPSGHNYRREESVEIAPTVEKVINTVKSGGKISGMPETAVLAEEFDKIAKAPNIIRTKSNNPGLIEEIDTWLTCFEELGKAGSAALKAIENSESNNLGTSLTNLVIASESMADMAEIAQKAAEATNKKNKDSYQKPAKSGLLVIRPAIETMIDAASASILPKISGRPGSKKRPYVSTSQTEGIENMLDDDPSSMFYCKEVLKKGDYFGVDLGSVQPIKNVSITMGRNDNDTDAVNKGQLEASEDGKRWFPLLDETTGLHIKYEGTDKKARFVRYRCTQAGVPGGKPDVWTAFRDFKVNAPSAPVLVTNLPQLQSLPVETENNSISIKRLLEIVPINKGGVFGITLPDGANVLQAKINLKTPDLSWASVEITQDGKTWTRLPVKKAGDAFTVDINGSIKGIKLTNIANAKKEVYLEEFSLQLPASSSSQEMSKLFDENLSTRAELPLGADAPAIPCAYPSSSAVIVISDGTPAEVYVQDADNTWQKAGAIGARQARVATVNLSAIKKPVKAIKFKGASDKTISVTEIIWKQ